MKKSLISHGRMTGVGSEGHEGHLGTISGPVWRSISEVNSGSILGRFWVILGPFLGPFLGNLINILKLPSFGRG